MVSKRSLITAPQEDTWERAPLSSRYSVKYGKANPGRPGGIPVVGSSGVYAFTADPLVLHPTIVVGRKGSAGEAWLIDVPRHPADTTFYLEPLDPATTDLAFTYFALHHFKMSASDDVIPSLQRHDLENLALPFPPISEQRAIAGILTKIQAAIEVHGLIVARLKELKAATMVKLFHEGLRGEPLKQTEIGEVPESWTIVPLSSIASIERGQFAHRPRNDPRFYGGTVPFIQTGDVAKANGRVTAHTQTLNELGLAVSRLFQKGTIVLTIAANIADTAILDFDAAFPDSLVGIRPTTGVDPAFLEHYLRTQKPAMNRLAPKGTHKNINIQFLKPWPVPVPSPVEQQEIAHILGSLDRRLELASKTHDALKSIFSSMLHLLMTGAARVTHEMIARERLRERIANRKKWTGVPDERTIHEIVQRIVEVADPEKIVLFGSAARGEMGPDSDLDFLVVKAGVDRRETANVIRRSLIGLAPGLPKDVIVVTPEDIERHRNTIGYIIRPALREGKVVYAA